MELGHLFRGAYKGKKVLVTGHTGFKGSWLCHWLDKMGANVLGYSLEPKYTPNHFSILNSNINSVIGDIRDKERLNQTIINFQPEVIFHLAAQPLVRYSYSEPVETFETNIMGTINLLESVRLMKRKVSLVIITTDKCYQNLEKNYGYKETDRLGGYDPYSNSKACTELVTQSYVNSFFNLDNYSTSHNVLVGTARAGNVIGGGDWSEDRLIPDIIRAATKNSSVQIRNPNAVRPWQHVLESLSGYLLLGQYLIEEKLECASSFNFGPITNESTTVSEVAHIAKKNWNKINIEFENKKSDLHEANLLMLDCSKANKVLGWRPVWSEEESIKNTIRWYQEFYENKKVISDFQLIEYIKNAQLNNLIWT